MFKRVLVAVDGSAPAEKALRAALALAKEQRASLRIVFVAEVLPPPAAAQGTLMDVDGYREAVLSGGRAIIRKAAERARVAHVRADAAVLESLRHDPAADIVGAAKRWRADLIVLGTHGRTGLARLFLGSVAEGVARHATTAVLLVRRGARVRR